MTSVAQPDSHESPGMKPLERSRKVFVGWLAGNLLLTAVWKYGFIIWVEKWVVYLRSMISSLSRAIASGRTRSLTMAQPTILRLRRAAFTAAR